MEDMKKKKKKLKMKKRKMEGKDKTVGIMQRVVDKYTKGTMKGKDRVEIE